MKTEKPNAAEATEPQPPKVAVVILNWNGAEMMRRFLPSVISGTASDGTVIVADNGSTDNSCDVIRREFPAVQLIELSENYGFAEGYNRALAEVEADYYVLLNSDVECPEGWLRPLVDYMEAHEDVAACQPKLLAHADRTSFEYAGAAGGFIDWLGYPFCRGRIFGDVEHDEGQYDTVADVFWATGAALMVRRSDWEAVGGLDARFFAHQEEIDMCWRLRSRGRRIVCLPSSHVWHVGGASLNQGNPRKTFLNFRNNLIMLYKNLPARDLRRVMRLRFWLDYLAALQFLLKGDVKNAAAVRRGRKAFKQMRRDLDADRERNLAAAVTEDIPERVGFSLLVAYYLKGKKKFSQLGA